VDNDEAMKIAVSEDNLNTVKLLIESGIDIKLNEIKYLRTFNSLDMIKLLVKNGININAGNDIAFRNFQQDLDIMEYLLKKGVNININNGEVLIEHSSSSLYREHVELLIKYGADVSVRNNMALKFWVYDDAYADADIVKLLVSNGADLHVDDDLPLRICIANYNLSETDEYLEIIKYLLKNGANIHVRDDAIIKTVLTNTDDEYYEDILKILIKYGADPNIKFNKNEIPELYDEEEILDLKLYDEDQLDQD